MALQQTGPKAQLNQGRVDERPMKISENQRRPLRNATKKPANIPNIHENLGKPRREHVRGHGKEAETELRELLRRQTGDVEVAILLGYVQLCSGSSSAVGPRDAFFLGVVKSEPGSHGF